MDFYKRIPNNVYNCNCLTLLPISDLAGPTFYLLKVKDLNKYRINPTGPISYIKNKAA